MLIERRNRKSNKEWRLSKYCRHPRQFISHKYKTSAPLLKLKIIDLFSKIFALPKATLLPYKNSKPVNRQTSRMFFKLVKAKARIRFKNKRSPNQNWRADFKAKQMHKKERRKRGSNKTHFILTLKTQYKTVEEARFNDVSMSYLFNHLLVIKLAHDANYFINLASIINC